MHAGFSACANGEVGSGHVEVAPPCRFVATTVEQEAVDGQVDVWALGPHACATGIPQGHVNEVQRTLRVGKHLDEGIRTGGAGKRGGGHLHLTWAVMPEGRACFEQSSAPQGHLGLHITVHEKTAPAGACSGTLQRRRSDVKAALDVDDHAVCDAKQHAIAQGEGAVRSHRQIPVKVIRAPLGFEDRPSGERSAVQA